ncbi:MAG: hypothetical protein WDZ83_00350 [Rhizobiaceae bacterium]
MDRAWYREKIVDKVLLGALSSVFLALVLFSVNQSEKAISYIRENTQVELRFAEQVFNGFVESVGKTSASFEEYLIFDDKQNFQKTIVAQRAPIALAATVFQEEQPKNLGEAMSDCVNLHEVRLNLSELNALKGSVNDQAQIRNLLKNCITESVRGYAQYRKGVVNKHFNSVPEWNQTLGWSQFLRLDYLLLIAMTTMLVVMIVIMYARSPGAGAKSASDG